MAKNNRRGQAKIWTPYAIGKMRKNLNSPAQRLAFEISLLTGERMGAITQLQVNDIYDEQGKLLEQITFRGETRKSTRWGQAKTRKVYLNPMNERVFVKLPSAKNWLSFSITIFTHQGISRLKRSIAKARNIFDKENLKGYSTHSSRRWLINILRRQGTSILTIAEIMTMTLNTVRHYCDDNPEACRNAILNLAV